MTSVIASNPEHTSSEPLLPEVRRMAWPILALTVANGIFLYGLPQLAATCEPTCGMMLASKRSVEPPSADASAPQGAPRTLSSRGYW